MMTSASALRSHEMTLMQRLEAWQAIGGLIGRMSDLEIDALAEKAGVMNPWFTNGNVRQALAGIQAMLEVDVLKRWVSGYDLQDRKPQTVGLILAGNIPLVGFQDLLAVSIAGHKAMVKLSAQDEVLPRWLIGELAQIAPELAIKIAFVDRLTGFDAVIATGSNNSSRYFEHYFGKVPNIIRKNRHSAAVITGQETDTNLVNLGHDVFSYFGHGCRNVSHLLLPRGYDIPHLLDLWHEPFHNLVFHNKFANNYEYNRAIYLVNSVPFLDTGYLVVKESNDLASPLAVLHYHYYDSETEVLTWLNDHQAELQCIVGEPIKSYPSQMTPFGQSQTPLPWDFADGIDTLQFLLEL